jgi:hypothetical protein
MEKVTAYTTVNNKKYEYSIEDRKKGLVFVECRGAAISQHFHKEDVGNLLIDLPHLIVAEQEYHERQSEVVRFRISPEDKVKIQQKALKAGFSSLSKYMRSLALS